MKKVAVIVETYPKPTENFIYRGLKELRDQGVDIQLFYMWEGKGEDILREDTFKLPSLLSPVNLLVYFWHLWNAKRRFLKLFWNTFVTSKRIAADLYHLFSAVHFAQILWPYRNNLHIHAEFATLPARYARYAAFLLQIEYSVSAHARDIFVINDDLIPNLKDASYIFFCTQAAMDAAYTRIGTIKDRSACVYHGITISDPDSVPHRKSSKKTLRITAAGRFIEKKGFEFLIQACRILTEKGIKVKCVFAGNGPLQDRFETLVKQENLEEIAEFPGFLKKEQMEKLWQETDILCVPSIKAKNGDMDGIPNVILEAAVRGIPAMVSDLPGLCEAVTDGHNGICVPSGSAEDLAQGLEGFHTMSAQAKKKMSENAFNTVKENFDIKKNMTEWLDKIRQAGVEI